MSRQYVLYDVETTGLTSRDEVIECAVFILDEQLSCRYVNDFYCMSTVPIHPDAQRVHGISLGMLQDLSKGKFFEEYFEDVKKRFNNDTTFIAYSSSFFDERLINQTLTNAGMPTYDFGAKIKDFRLDDGHKHQFDLMGAVAPLLGGRGGKIKLETAVSKVASYGKEECIARYKAFTKAVPKQTIPGHDCFHDARFDVFCMWFIIDKLKDKL